MADYRQIHTCIWKDSWFIELCQEYKLLFIYLFSNERANLTGLYDLSLRVVAFETGLDMETIEMGLAEFATAGKVYYEDGMVWVPTLLRHNARNITSPKINTHIRAIIQNTRNCPLKARWIAYYNQNAPDGYRIDTLSIPVTQVVEEHVPVPVPVPVLDLVPDKREEGHVGQEFYTSYNPPPSVRIYGDLTREQVPTGDIARQMHEAIGIETDALENWHTTINAWLRRGYSKRNITGMLDWFVNGIQDNGRTSPPANAPPSEPRVLNIDLDAVPKWMTG